MPSLFDIAALQKLRLSTLTALGRYPNLFNRIAALGSSADTLVKPTTDLCVEAPPRSANAFFVVGFQMANPWARVAHHHHAPAQVLTAIKLGRPVLTILRNPIESALAKAAPTSREFLIGTTFRKWISFWETLQPVLTEASPVLFEDVVTLPGGVIKQVNERYQTSFSTDFPPQSAVFSAIESSRVASAGRAATTSPSPNVPSPEIAKKEQSMRPAAEGHPLARPASALYEELRAVVPRV
jgi:hypothetical protein